MDCWTDFGLIFELVVGRIVELMFGLMFGLIFELIFVRLCGLMFGRIFGWIVRRVWGRILFPLEITLFKNKRLADTNHKNTLRFSLPMSA